MADIARVKVEAFEEVPEVADERYMPMTEHEFFAWATHAAGRRWRVEPVRCGRVWQRVDEACYE